MMKKFLYAMLTLLAFSLSAPALAQAPDLRVESPLTAELRESMKSQFRQLRPWVENGALGFKMDGSIIVRDPSVVPLSERQGLSILINANARDKAALYREIARLNGQPQLEQEIAKTTANRMRERMPAGWWIQDDNGVWSQKKATE
jgi:uncharacterized protein YdbL (DUF1318 family)